jgi:RNA polymerase sigma-70 factor (ECF subfamily)
MEAHERDALEQAIRSRCDQGDLAGAATVAIRGYGDELFGFIAALHRSEDDASEVFARVAERLWSGLGGFGWQSSFRTWAYAVARNESRYYRRGEGLRARRNAPLPDGSDLSEVVAEVRSRTITFLRTEQRTRLAELRDSLPPDDRALLVLRIDRELSWIDLARVLHGDEEPLGEEALKRESARLRKRFQLVKDRLREMARREGLLGPEKDGR